MTCYAFAYPLWNVLHFDKVALKASLYGRLITQRLEKEVIRASPDPAACKTVELFRSLGMSESCPIFTGSLPASETWGFQPIRNEELCASVFF
ncbi:hypothetical protein D3C85_896750 [compost metagenome]